jgi:hypothetical protein
MYPWAFRQAILRRRAEIEEGIREPPSKREPPPRPHGSLRRIAWRIRLILQNLEMDDG